MNAYARSVGTRLPALGSRGEGWVAVQVAFLVLIVVAGFAGPAWVGEVRLAGVAAGSALLTAGVTLIVAGIALLRRQLTPFPHPVPGGNLIADGPFALVRHPMYGGALMASLGWALVTASIASIAVTVAAGIFLDLKSRREEAWLSEQFAGYEAYARSTRRLIPFLY
jgi:protein-S-isoprenylcysteine O-methyltransferase Ste14